MLNIFDVSDFFFGAGVGCGDNLHSTLPARWNNTHGWTQLKQLKLKQLNSIKTIVISCNKYIRTFILFYHEMLDKKNANNLLHSWLVAPASSLEILSLAVRKDSASLYIEDAMEGPP